jgi:hypothetical protein
MLRFVNGKHNENCKIYNGNELLFAHYNRDLVRSIYYQLLAAYTRYGGFFLEDYLDNILEELDDEIKEGERR